MKIKKISFLILIFGAVLFLTQKTNAQTTSSAVSSCVGQPENTPCDGNGFSGFCQSNLCVMTSSINLEGNQTTGTQTATDLSSCINKADGTPCEGNGVSGVCQNYLCSAIGNVTAPVTNQTLNNPTGNQPQTNPTGNPPAGQQFDGKGIVIPEGTGLPDPPNGIAQIIRNLLTWLLGIVGVIAIIGFVISGIQYLTSAGNEDQMQSAKRNMLYAIIGVVVVLSSYVIIQAIQYALEAKSMF